MAVALNGGSADPYSMYNRYWTKTGNPQKVANYIDDTLDSQMQKGRVETDPAKRKVIFADFEKTYCRSLALDLALYCLRLHGRAEERSGLCADTDGLSLRFSKVSIQ